MEVLAESIAHALLLSLILCAPLLFAGVIVGLGLSILQAASQIQEATTTFTAKLFAIGVMLFLMSGWMSAQLLDFTRLSLERVTLLQHDD